MKMLLDSLAARELGADPSIARLPRFEDRDRFPPGSLDQQALDRRNGELLRSAVDRAVALGADNGDAVAAVLARWREAHSQGTHARAYLDERLAAYAEVRIDSLRGLGLIRGRPRQVVPVPGVSAASPARVLGGR
jgi:hypothetical protein